MLTSDTFISVVTVLHNNGGIVESFVREVHQALSAEFEYFEIVLVDNASRDDLRRSLQPLLDELVGLRLLRLSRPMADEIAETAGLQTAIGDYTAIMHVDYDSAAALMQGLRRAREGHDFVQGTCDVSGSRSWAYRVLRRGFYLLCRRWLKLDLIESATVLRVMSRQAVNGLTRIRSRRRYFSLLAAEVGLSRTEFAYELISRSGRRPRPGWKASVRQAVSLIIHSSMRPLRVVGATAVVGSYAILCYMSYVVVIYFVKDDVMPGWTTLSLQVSGLFFLLFIMVALIGEYLGRLLDETSDRPLYYVRDERSSSVMLFDPERPNIEHRADPARADPTRSGP